MADDVSAFLGVPAPAPTPPPSRPTDFTAMLKARYSDAFTEAHAVVTVGKVVKGIAVAIAAILLFIGLSMSDRGGSQFAIGGFVLGFIVGIPIYVLGILVKSHGQSQLAELDTAVNCSRHLKDDDVQEILTRRFHL